MSDGVIVAGKTGLAKQVRAAVDARFGPVPTAEGHLPALLEPEEVEPPGGAGRPPCRVVDPPCRNALIPPA